MRGRDSGGTVAVEGTAMSHQSIETSDAPPVSSMRGRPRSTACSPLHLVSDIDAHPVFAALDGPTRQRLSRDGRERALDVGDTLDAAPAVTFVLDGILGTFCASADVCVTVAGSGCVLGLERLFDAPSPRPVETLVPGRVFIAPPATLIDALGRDRVMELSMRHTRARLRDMEDEAACNASHLVSQRLAKWLLRLHRANRARDLAFTQADIARLMGVQRTSVNTAARQLQITGAARFTRGKVVIRNADLLAQSACSCAA